jgi:2-polyprenyl-6-methoxyphenol hydroxylase-like FAD-dependent oxidoreductase
VIVVGGGPVGTFTALRLARAGIKILLLEADAVPSNAPRAAVCTGPSVFELQRAEILEDVRALGLQLGDVCWRKRDGEIIAGLDRKTPNDPLNPVTLDQYRLENVILKHMEAYPNVKTLWGHKVTALEQDADSVTVTVETLEGEPKHFTAEYVIGADGGRSTVRKLIDVKFEGFTWHGPLVIPQHFLLIVSCY